MLRYLVYTCNVVTLFIYFGWHWVIYCIHKLIWQNVLVLCHHFWPLIKADVIPTAEIVQVMQHYIVYELIWNIYCISDMIQGLIWTLNAYYLLCFVEEVIQVICLCLAIIDFVNNCIKSFCSYISIEDSHCLYKVLIHCKHVLVFFVLSRKQVHHQWKSSLWLSLLGQQSVEGFLLDLACIL